MRRMSSTHGIIRAAMAIGDPIYTEEQREAIAVAYIDRRIRPAGRVVELAQAGQLVHNGQPLPAFQTNASTVRSEGRKHLKARRGELVSDLAAAPHRDAVDALRRRCINAADALLKDFERKQIKNRDPEQLRQIIRVVREAAALPSPVDQRPTAPGQKENGQRNGGHTQGGIGGALLKDHRTSQARPAQDDQQNKQEDGEHHGPEPEALEQQEPKTDDEPGSPTSTEDMGLVATYLARA